jgi:hypothetical protein
MPFDLGDIVPLSVTITDGDGVPADAGEVKVTITLPDGTSAVSAAITPTDTGVYDYDYSAVQAGRHGVRWVATGDNAAVFTDAFTVEPSDPDAFISLADVNTFLKRPQGDELADWVRPACRMIRDRIGHVSPVTVTEDLTGRGRLVLKESPVIEVVSVERLPGLSAVSAADLAAGVAGWVLDGPAGLLSLTAGVFGPVRVTYRAGRSPVPPNITLAGKELAGHLWRASQLNDAGGRPPLTDNDMPVMPGAAFALPIRVRELLGLGRGMYGDEVLVG